MLGLSCVLTLSKNPWSDVPSIWMGLASGTTALLTAQLQESCAKGDFVLAEAASSAL